MGQVLVAGEAMVAQDFEGYRMSKAIKHQKNQPLAGSCRQWPVNAPRVFQKHCSRIARHD